MMGKGKSIFDISSTFELLENVKVFQMCFCGNDRKKILIRVTLIFQKIKFCLKGIWQSLKMYCHKKVKVVFKRKITKF